MHIEGLADDGTCKQEADGPRAVVPPKPTAQEIADAIIAHVKGNIGQQKSFAN